MIFEEPTQVQFLDDEGTIQVGIAYGNKIICACCGGVFEMDEVSDIISLAWVDLTDSIG